MAIENPTQKLKPVMDETFKFAIGDLAGMAALQEAMKAELKINGKRRRDRFTPQVGASFPLTVTTRWVEECHGGIQLKYSVHGLNEDGAATTVTVFEYELVPYSEMVATADSLLEAPEQD